MKNSFFSIALISLFSFNLQAQANDEAGVLAMWDSVWKSYESNDEAKMWSFYSQNACEVYPDGSAVCGLAQIKAGYDAFKGMLEGTPSWTYTKPEVRFIEPNVALLLGDITTDMKLKGGQQIGGKMKFSALVHKVGGKWLIEYDSQTPMMQMPEQGK